MHWTEAKKLLDNATIEDKRTKRVDVGIGHILKAMQVHGFGYEELNAMYHVMLNNKSQGIDFVSDIYFTKTDNNPDKAPWME